MATLLIKKIRSTVSPLGGHFCIRFSREEEAATVSPIDGHLRSKKYIYCVTFTCHSFICFSACCYTLDTLPCCVTYTWHSSPHFVTEEDGSTVSPLPAPVYKNAGTISKKIQHPPGVCRQSSSSKFWQHIYRNRQSTKKNLANAPADLKKNEIENEKNDGIAALSTI